MTVSANPPTPVADNVSAKSVTKVDSVPVQPKPKCHRSTWASVSPAAAANVTVTTGLPPQQSHIWIKQEKNPEQGNDYLTVRIKKEDLCGFNIVEHEGQVLAEWKPQPNRYVYSYFVLIKYDVYISSIVVFLPGIHHSFLN